MKPLATLLMTLAMAAASQAAEIGFIEDFSLADDRSQTVGGNHEAELGGRPVELVVHIKDHLWLNEREGEEGDEVDDHQRPENIEGPGE